MTEKNASTANHGFGMPQGPILLLSSIPGRVGIHYQYVFFPQIVSISHVLTLTIDRDI